MRESHRTAHSLTRSADLRYAHQGSELTVQYPDSQVNREGLESMVQEFHLRHHQLYGFSLEQPVEIVTLRVTASGQVGQVRMPPLPGGNSGPDLAVVDRRKVVLRGVPGVRQLPHLSAAPAWPWSGPQRTCRPGRHGRTVVINPGWQANIDRYGNCIMRGSRTAPLPREAKRPF